MFEHICNMIKQAVKFLAMLSTKGKSYTESYNY